MTSAPPGHTPKQGRDFTAEHYVETVFYIRFEEGKVRPGRLAHWMGVSAPSVTVALQRLERDGWLRIGEDRSVTLTDKGDQLADRIVRVHRLLERWLTDVMGLDWAVADEEAQLLAPGVSDRLADIIDKQLNHPATCPHGNLIPGRKPPYGELVALADLPSDKPAHIRRISEVAEHDAPDLLADLRDYGLMTGTKISLAAGNRAMDALSVKIGDQIRPIGTGVARLIWVEPVR
jgi:DtxR family transcriptional regulator, Mn-dependent transcriptional regulator